MDKTQFMSELKAQIARWCGDTLLGMMLLMREAPFKSNVGSYIRTTMIGARAKAAALNLDVEAELVQLEEYIVTYVAQ